MPDNIFIYYIDLPYKIAGTVILNDDASYTIYINRRLSIERQYKALRHELRHITNNDLYSELSIREIEENYNKDD